MRPQKYRGSIKCLARLVEKGSEPLENVRDARCHLELDRHIGCRCPPGEPESVAQQYLVRTRLDQQRRQSAEIPEDRADIGSEASPPAR